MRQLREDCAAKVTKIQQKGKLQYMIKLLALQRDRKERKVMGIICDIGLKERISSNRKRLETKIC